MIYLYYFVLITCLLFIRQKKMPFLFWLLVFSSIALLASSMRVGYDTENFIRGFDEMTRYKNYYDERNIITVGYGYASIIRFFNFIGINNFFLFKFLVVSISVSFITFAINKISIFPVCILFLYLIGPFFDDAMQLRNTISLSFMYLAFYSLYEKKDKFLFFFLLMSVANHLLFTLIALFFCAVRFGKDKFITCIFWIGLGAYVFVFFTHNFNFYSQIQSLINIQKFSDTVESSTNFGSLIALTFYLQLYFITYFCDKKIQKREFVGSSFAKVDIKRLSTLIFNLVKVAAIILPFCVITLSAMRFHRDLILLVLCESVLLYSIVTINKRYRRSVLFATFLTMISFMYVSNFFMGPPEDIIYSVLYGDPSWLLMIF